MKRDSRKAAKSHPKVEPNRVNWGRYAVHAPVLAVLLLALVAYSGSFHAPFLLDSVETVAQDARVHADTPENVHRIFTEPYGAVTSGLYRPVTTWSYLLNYAIFGDRGEPSGYHRLNFLLHAINILLVYALALALFEDRTAALAASGIWAVHPVLVESVTGIAGRAEMLAAFGILAAILCYRAAVLAGGARRLLWTAGVLFAAAVGVFSNESGVIAIAAIGLYDQLFLRDRPVSARAAAFAAAAVPTAAFLALRASVLAKAPAGLIPFVDNPLVGATFWPARITACKVVARYLGLLFWPARLSPDYSYNAVPVGIDAGGVVGLVLCAAAVAAAVWASKRHKALAFAIALFLVALAPVANVFFFIGRIMAERFLYLPAAGLVCAVVYGLSLLASRGAQARKATAALVCVIVGALAVRTYARNGDWSSADRLWATAVQAAPGSYNTHIQYAATLPLLKAANRNRAAAEIAASLAILQSLPPAQNAPAAYRIAGAIYRQMGDEVALGRADRDGSQPKDWYDRALPVLFQSAAMEEVRNEALVALNQRRGTPRSTFLPSSVFFEIGRTYLRMANQLQALSYYERGRSLEPNADLLEDEAATLASYGDYRRAAQLYIEALEVDGSRTDLGATIAEMYTKAEPNGCASKGGALDPKCPMVHEDICGAARNVENTYARRGQAEDAAAVRRVAIVDLGCTGAEGSGAAR